MQASIAQELGRLGAAPAALERLEIYVAQLLQWNKAINLVAPASLADVWTRHILDSAQLWPFIADAPNKTIVDLGSGGGLPGLIMACFGATVTMIESDQRKGVFLREVARLCGLNTVTVISTRIEKAPAIVAPFVTARALAPLPQLVQWAEPFLAPDGKMLFLKGQEAAVEITNLQNTRPGAFHVEQHSSITDSAAALVVVTRL